MKVIPWGVPIRAGSARSNNLKSLHFDRDGLVLTVLEEETEQAWKITFTSVQAFRVITEECPAPILENIPAAGGFFEVKDSSWIQELGKGDIPFLDQSRHFVVSCYDEVVEVVAWESQQTPVST